MPRPLRSALLAASLSLLAWESPAAAGIVAADDFDAPVNLLSRTGSPEFHSFRSSFQLFGVYGRDGEHDLGPDLFDDTSFGGSGGIIRSGKRDNVFAVQDPGRGGAFEATWEFDLGGQTLSEFAVELAAVGGFESTDRFRFAASVDGGPAVVLFETATALGEAVTYTYENGSAETEMSALEIGDRVLSNRFQTFSTDAVAGLSGDRLRLTFSGSTTGIGEVFALDNVRFNGGVAAVPEPGSWALMLLAAGGLAARRRR